MSIEQKLLEKIQTYNEQNPDKKMNILTIQEAIEWCKKYHQGQKRKSGEPYHEHPLAVAYYCLSIKRTTAIIVAALLHDVVEDSSCTLESVEKKFGKTIRILVHGLTRKRKEKILSVEEILTENYKGRNTKDILCIKLMDRKHNLETLDSMSMTKKEKIAKQTLNEFIILSIYLEQEKQTAAFHKLLSQYFDEEGQDFQPFTFLSKEPSFL